MQQDKNMYQKGISKKNRIVHAAKELFYEYGYDKTTVAMIKDRAEVSLSAIPYYFKEKDRIINIIYNDFLSSIYNLINKKITNDMDSYLRHFHASKIFYYVIFNDENNKRFYYEVSVAQSNYKLLYPFMNNVYLNYARDFNIKLTDKEFRLIRMSDAGARREIMLKYYEDTEGITLDEMADYVTSIVGTLMGIDKNVAKIYGRLSTEFASGIDYSSIKFLV